MGEKRFLTYDEQITFLEKEKGLIISNKEYAKKILLKIGYFPLINGYKEIFKEPINNQFQKGTSFEDIYELYDFDNDLRNIFIKYILLAERNIKSSLSYHFCKEYGDLQSDYLNVNNYERLQIPKEKGRYTYGKNDLYAQVIILKLLLSTEDFHKFFHDLKCVLKSIQYTRKSLGKWDFQRIGKELDELKTI